MQYVDNMCHFSKILADLQKQQELIQQQIEEKETEVKASDIVDIRRRQAALEQRVLNLQIHFQDFIDSHTQLQALCQQQQTRIDELYTQVSQVLAKHSDDPTYDLSCDRLTLIGSGQQDLSLDLTTLYTALGKEQRPSTVVAGAKLRTPSCFNFLSHFISITSVSLRLFSMTQSSSRLFPPL